MTAQEMTEIFAVLLLAYPSAEMFKGGINKLGPTIAIWTASLSDVDYWTAERAAIRVCRECKFPPSIAEFRAHADMEREKLSREISDTWSYIRMMLTVGRTPEDVYKSLGPKPKAAIDLMGGPDKLYVQETHTLVSGKCEEFTTYNSAGFRRAYEQIIKGENVIPGIGKGSRAIGPGKGGTVT